MFTDSRPEQLLNALTDISVTASGIIIDFNELQPTKDCEPIMVREDGNTTEVSSLLSEKPLVPILVIPSGIEYVVNPAGAKDNTVLSLTSNLPSEQDSRHCIRDFPG